MSRYIDADKLMKYVDRIDISYGTDIDDIIFELEKIIHKQPTADVVEVVRCKDCFSYQKDKELAKANYLDPEKYCALLICEIDKNGFCSYGERMDGETNDG